MEVRTIFGGWRATVVVSISSTSDLRLTAVFRLLTMELELIVIISESYPCQHFHIGAAFSLLIQVITLYL